MILIFSFLSANIFAQSVLLNTGARNEGLAGQSAVSRDEWAIWRNPAGLTYVDATTASFGTRQVPIINVPARSALLAVKTRAGCLAAGVSAFGDDLYSEHAMSLAFAHKIGITNVGVRADVFQLRIDGNGIKRTFGVTIGGITAIGSRLLIGAVARNVNLPQWAEGQPLPVVLNAGLLFMPTDIFSVIAEVEKNTDLDPTIKGAVEYTVKKKLFVRTGFNLFPNAAFGGIGLRMWRMGFDYAVRWGYLPGYFHMMSVSIRTKTRDK
ncbi:MAG TPA: hypothetical protein VK508_01055 [Cyclobacteriaceae bacterium]|nr:hypothetical protein [Cyclobacteriaceae bacterium]